MDKNIIKKLATPLIVMFLLTACSSDNNEHTSEVLKEDTVVKNESQVEIDTAVGSTSSNNESESNEQINSQNTESEIHFIDTGNSDAILIKQGNKAALIDGGDNDDESRVVSYLKEQGVSELEYIFATHPHADHIGGLDAVVNDIPTKKVYVSNGDADTKTYRDFIYAMSNKGLAPSVPLLNSEFKLGKSTFKVLSVANTNDPNNNSLVLLYTNGEDKVLLMGDAEKEIESKLNVGEVDLIKIGHHGSYSSSTPSFIKNINPKYAVLTVGADNKYGHPHVETMDTLKGNNIEVHRNDECGNVVFKSTGSGVEVDCKVGSYNRGNKQNGSSSSNTSVNSNNGPSSSNNNTNSSSNDKITPPEQTSENTTGDGVVYWTPNGKSYHTTKSCSTLSRSKTINSGTIQESDKYDPCDRCH